MWFLRRRKIILKGKAKVQGRMINKETGTHMSHSKLKKSELPDWQKPQSLTTFLMMLWGNRDFHRLLVKMQNDATTMERNWDSISKITYAFTL